MLRITNLLVQASLQTGQTFRRIHVTAGSTQLRRGVYLICVSSAVCVSKTISLCK